MSAPGGPPRPTLAPSRPGQATLALGAVALGLVLMAVQLWLLTVALDLLLAGRGAGVWQIAVVSALIFAGGVAIHRLLRRRPRVARRP